jgi:TolA-binding protein
MVICAVLGRAAARAQTPDEMQKEIQTMKQQIEELQEKTRKQAELIEKAGAPREARLGELEPGRGRRPGVRASRWSEGRRRRKRGTTGG